MFDRNHTATTAYCGNKGKDMKIAINIRQTAPGCFQADCVTMPGCIAIGQTQDQVCRNMQREITYYLASMDAILPQQLDFVVSFSIRHVDKPEPETPINIPRRVDIIHSPLPMRTGRLATRKLAKCGTTPGSFSSCWI